VYVKENERRRESFIYVLRLTNGEGFVRSSMGNVTCSAHHRQLGKVGYWSVQIRLDYEDCSQTRTNRRLLFATLKMALNLHSVQTNYERDAHCL
jgi:hypothetical protein